jgi:hypothetical protein
MSLISFKSAAQAFKADFSWNKASMAAAVCEMAHAITRGRNPSSTISGTNVRVWWRDAKNDTTCGQTDYMGEPCDIIYHLYETGNDMCDVPEWLAMRNAVDVCHKHFNRVGWPKRPLTAEEKQQRHDDWLNRKQGGDYQDYEFDYLD